MARLFFSFVKTSLYINFVYCKESLVLLQGISRLIARNLSSYEVWKHWYIRLAADVKILKILKYI